MSRKTLSLLLLFSTLLSCEVVTRSQVIMGTFGTITLEDKSQQHIQKSFKLLKEIERSLSSYNKNAKVYQLNHQKEVATDEYLKEVLEKSRQIYKQSIGYFDITIGSVTKGLYRFGEDEKIPSQKELLAAKIDLKGIIEKSETIRLKKGIKIDFGGIGKGYGVDKVAEYLSKQNITKGKIGLSGDIRCIDKCTFAIQSPFEENQTLMSFESKIPNLSISTSGTYLRYIKEKKHHHLINPTTKRQGRAFVSVTILTQGDNAKADAIATAVSVMPKPIAILFLEGIGVGYLLVEGDGNIIQSYIEEFATTQTHNYKPNP